jgi:hypothetical protein
VAIHAPYVVEDRSGITVAVAIVFRIDGPTPTKTDVEQWVRQLDAALPDLFGTDACSPVGVAIRVTERRGRGVEENLILDAAVDCPRHFKRAEDEQPTRTVVHFDAPPGNVTN